MATRSPSNPKSKFIDKRWLREKLAEMDTRSGLLVDPTVTVQQVREMMLADGIRPEDNEFSREILAVRDEASSQNYSSPTSAHPLGGDIPC